MNVRKQTKSFSKTFEVDEDLNKINEWVKDQIETETFAFNQHFTRHKYVITVTKIISDDDKK